MKISRTYPGLEYEDLVQETELKLLELRTQGKNITPGFAHTGIVNRLRDIIRHYKRQPETVSLEEYIENFKEMR